MHGFPSVGPSKVLQSSAGKPVVRPTTLITSPRLDRRLGLEVTLAAETFQVTGSFKFRAAFNLADKVPHRHLITASSGNFGQALACACRMLGKTCLVVMPDTSARVKIEAVREFGATVELIDTRNISRQARVRELAASYSDAYVASAYDDPLVIEGNATLGSELAALNPPCDAILAPVGGGGLTSGLITGLRAAGNLTPVTGVEPVIANDAARSLRLGELVRNESEPVTLADGVRTLSLGDRNWEILRKGLSGIVEVSEAEIADGVRLLFELANLKAEPTGALGIAALLSRPELFQDRRICCVVSGGNVDPKVFQQILGG